MIDREEILAQSEELQVHTSHVQRDYMYGWLLSAIFGHSELADQLILKGGNAFRKAYFQKARYSPDLDFATPLRLTNDYLRSNLNSVCSLVSDATEVVFDTDRTRVESTPSSDRDKTIQKARLYFKDFFGEESQIVLAVRLDVSNYERIFLETQDRDLIHQYSDFSEALTTIRVLKLEELLASKLKCLLQRRHSVDLYDFVNATLIHPVIDINRSEMVETFLRMTIFRPGPRIVKDLLINLPFQILKGLWEKYLIAPSDSMIDFPEAVSGFTNIVTDLFGQLPVGISQYAFFPSELRNPIMQAGHDMTKLRISYHGMERIVEPYSLKFKQRRDGISREYLYVYDTTGGRSSGPGLKSLVADGFDSISNTDLQFEPKYEVELSKAGQLFGDTYFRGSPGQRFTYRYSASRRSTSKYVVQCTRCGKRFYRKKRSTKINPHKDESGRKCYGRRGILV